MHALVVTLMLSTPGVAGLVDDKSPRDDREAARIERDRCLGAGAAGVVGTALGLVIGAGIALGLGEIVQAADTNHSSASKGFDAFAVPAAALAGAVAGAALGTIGAYDLAGTLVGKPSVLR